MSFATDKAIVDVTTSTRPRECSTCQAGDFGVSPSFSTPLPHSTIKYCDSPYHIIFTNVKMISRDSRTRQCRAHDRLGRIWWRCFVTGPRKITWLQAVLQRGTSTNRPETCPVRS